MKLRALKLVGGGSTQDVGTAGYGELLQTRRKLPLAGANLMAVRMGRTLAQRALGDRTASSGGDYGKFFVNSP